MRKTLSLANYIGNKSSSCFEYRDFLPADGFSSAWEAFAGTGAFSANVLSTMIDPGKIHLTDADMYMTDLLVQVQEKPFELITFLAQTEYAEKWYDWAEEICAGKQSSQLERAAAQYIMMSMSFNGMVDSGFRSIYYEDDRDFNSRMSARYLGERYKIKILELYDYSLAIRGINIINDDMIHYFERFSSDEEMFIFADIPYSLETRTQGMYRKDVSSEWHRAFSNMLYKKTVNGTLKANMMLCNYLGNIATDPYTKLLSVGWKMYLIKQVNRPTIIRKNMINKGKGKAQEIILLNYEPINMPLTRDRIITAEDVLKEIR